MTFKLQHDISTLDLSTQGNPHIVYIVLIMICCTVEFTFEINNILENFYVF
jgi:hypothetical protein